MLARLGVRGRLLLAFFGISALAVLGAGAALYSFHAIDDALALITQRRIPVAVKSQELSRHAERIVAAAPALLTTTSQAEKDDWFRVIASEVRALTELSADLRNAGVDHAALQSLEPDVQRLRFNLRDLDILVNDRLKLSTQKRELLRNAIQVASQVQGLLTPWISVMDERISQWRRLAQSPSIADKARAAADQDIEKSLAWSRALRASEVLASSISDLLQRAASADDVNAAGVSGFRLQQSINELERLAAQFDPKLRALVLETLNQLRPFVTGNDSIAALRRRELALTANGTRLLAENTEVSKRLTEIMERLVANASMDITEANADALSVVRFSTWALVIAVTLSLISSTLIVWLYVGRNIIARLTALSNRMLTLASGDLKSPLPPGGLDEIGRMAESLAVFRATAIEMEEENLREIREARTRLTDAIETISEGFSLYDVDDKLVIFNSKYKSLFSAHADVIEPGTTFEKIVRTAVQRGMIDDAEGGHEAWLAERTAQHKAPTSAHIQHRSDGRWIQVSERKTAAGGVVATYADITELKQREAELAAARDVAEATLRNLRTAQDRLIQTEKLASLGQLTAGIAHEIKNPLNFVNNFSAISVELIDELRGALAGANLDNKLRAEIGEIADMLQGNLEKVVQHGKRADAIVKNMLLHSRQGSGEHRPVDINAVVEESLNLAYHGARAEKQGFNITLESSFDPAAGEVDLFPQEITRVLLNLISNGFYAATKRKVEANGGQHEPTLAAVTKNLGDSVEIRIRDNGMGIPPEIKEKMFNPFFTTKPVGEGTGLGLSISHDIIVKQHGGSIEVDTQLGEFTEFRIVLPRGAATIAKSGERP